MFTTSGIKCDTIKEINADYIIVEYVERYSERLKDLKDIFVCED